MAYKMTPEHKEKLRQARLKTNMRKKLNGLSNTEVNSAVNIDKTARAVDNTSIKRKHKSKAVLQQFMDLREEILKHITKEKLEHSTAKSLSTMLGIVTDKLQILKGQPNNITGYTKRITINPIPATRENLKEHKTPTPIKDNTSIISDDSVDDKPLIN